MLNAPPPPPPNVPPHQAASTHQVYKAPTEVTKTQDSRPGTSKLNTKALKLECPTVPQALTGASPTSPSKPDGGILAKAILRGKFLLNMVREIQI